LLIVTVSSGFMRGRKEGMLIGFFSGLLIDLFYGSFFGYYALLYVLIGFFAGSFWDVFFDKDIKMPLILVGISDLALNLVIYATRFLIRGRFRLDVYMVEIILPEIVFTMLMTLIVYRIIYAVNHRFQDRSKEGRHSLWAKE
ncbi:MAG: rod shape-determining protein MreD, partial [Lachnospiraceae bacterium]